MFEKYAGKKKGVCTDSRHVQPPRTKKEEKGREPYHGTDRTRAWVGRAGQRK